MREYFDQEIKMLEKEITALKTSMAKSAGMIVMAEKTVDVTISLTLPSDTAIAPSGVAQVQAAGVGGGFLMATLDKYYDDISLASGDYDTRKRWIWLSMADGTIVVNIGASGTWEDGQTIRQGGSVSITAKLTVQATEDFTLEAIS